MRPGATVLLLLACWEAGCSGAGDSVSDGNAALAEAFGPAISIAQDRSPSVFHGDFNGDGRADLIAFARAERLPEPMPADVQVLQPWTASGDQSPGDLSRGADVMLAVVHAAGAGAGVSYLLHDPDTVSILDTGAARDAFVIDRVGASGLDAEVGRLARGDVLVIPTEAGIDTFLYWDGSTYRAFQPFDYP